MSGDQNSTATPSRSGRLFSLDAYRGGVMLLLAADLVGLNPARMLGFFPHNEFWSFLQRQWEHAPWDGCRLWDLIQPSFMFVVGVAMPFSYARRAEKGQSFPRMFAHACYRAVMLILLGVFLRSLGHAQTYWTFEDVLSQIGLGYVFLFLLWHRGWMVQASAAALILVGYWALWAFWPTVAAMLGVSQPAVAGWAHVGNPGQAFDVWLRNLLPHEKPFVNHWYYTLNFIPSLSTMIFGLMAGHLLRSDRSAARKLQILLAAGVAGLTIGWLLSWTGVCPIIKKIWTPSWAIFSAGWCCVILAGFYAVVDVRGIRRPFFPAIVLGMNSIGIYVLAEMGGQWLPETLGTHLDHTLLASASPAAAALVKSCTAALILWAIFYWMYRRKIFLRI